MQEDEAPPELRPFSLFSALCYRDPPWMSPHPPAGFRKAFILRGGFRPLGRVSFPAMGKKPKDRRERLTSPSGTGSLRLQFVLPRTPGIYGGPILGGYRSLSGAGGVMTDSAPAPLPLSIRDQDGLVCWTKQARLIAQVLISAVGNRRAGQETRPYGAISVMGDTMATAAYETDSVSP